MNRIKPLSVNELLKVLTKAKGQGIKNIELTGMYGSMGQLFEYKIKGKVLLIATDLTTG